MTFFLFSFIILILLKKKRKAIYDLLIELSASARLIPTNYTLKLYSKDENTNDIDKLIEYTPNQTIGQLSNNLFI